MLRINLILVVLFLFAMCNSKNDKNQNSTYKATETDSLRVNIIGKWGGKTGGPVFEIRKDSIYYFNKDSSYLYKLKGDTFSVKFNQADSFTLFGKLKVSHDTMQIIEYQTYNQVTYAYRQ